MGRPRKHPHLSDEEYKLWQRQQQTEYNRARRERLISEGKLTRKYRHGVLLYRNFEAHLIRTYGIDAEEYAWMWELGNYSCHICKRKLSLEGSKVDHPHVDHCHETNKVRGLLCHSCNIGLGMFRDSTTSLRNALAYLGESS